MSSGQTRPKSIFLSITNCKNVFRKPVTTYQHKHLIRLSSTVVEMWCLGLFCSHGTVAPCCHWVDHELVGIPKACKSQMWVVGKFMLFLQQTATAHFVSFKNPHIQLNTKPSGYTHSDTAVFLTETGCSKEADSSIRRLAGGVESLHQVVGECQRNNSLAGWLDQEDGRPQTNESQEATKRLQDVGVAGSRFGDGGAELCVAQSPKHWEDPAKSPDEQRQSIRSAVHEYALWWNKNPRADHVAHNEADPIQERNLPLQLHFLFFNTIWGL